MRTSIGKYEILAPLGAGGMAEVFLARKRGDRSGRLVALKCLRPSLARDPQLVLGFHDEARILSLLVDPRVAGFLESGCDHGTFYLALEYAHGAPLSDVLIALHTRRALAPMDSVAAVADDLLGALHVAHEARDEQGRPLAIVHRDVSPQNVIVGADGSCKLMDFGVARFRGQSHHSEGASVRGKMPYVAPEQIAATSEDRRSDVWAAAVVLYELATLSHPFAGHSPLETVERIRREPIPPLRAYRDDVPESFDMVLQLALTRPVDRRFETAGAFREALGCAWPLADRRRAIRRLLAEAFPEGLPDERNPQMARWLRPPQRTPRGKLAAAAALGALLGAATMSRAPLHAAGVRAWSVARASLDATTDALRSARARPAKRDAEGDSEPGQETDPARERAVAAQRVRGLRGGSAPEGTAEAAFEDGAREVPASASGEAVPGDAGRRFHPEGGSDPGSAAGPAGCGGSVSGCAVDTIHANAAPTASPTGVPASAGATGASATRSSLESARGARLGIGVSATLAHRAADGEARAASSSGSGVRLFGRLRRAFAEGIYGATSDPTPAPAEDAVAEPIAPSEPAPGAQGLHGSSGAAVSEGGERHGAAAAELSLVQARRLPQDAGGAAHRVAGSAGGAPHGTAAELSHDPAPRLPQEPGGAAHRMTGSAERSPATQAAIAGGAHERPLPPPRATEAAHPTGTALPVVVPPTLGADSGAAGDAASATERLEDESAPGEPSTAPSASTEEAQRSRRAAAAAAAAVLSGIDSIAVVPPPADDAVERRARRDRRRR